MFGTAARRRYCKHANLASAAGHPPHLSLRHFRSAEVNPF